MRSGILRKAALLAMLAVVLAVLMDYLVFTGDAGEVIRQYMELDSAGNVQSSKAAFRSYTYQLTEKTDVLEWSTDNYSAVMGQALADAAYAEYLLYQDEKMANHGGTGFGSWVYLTWFRRIAELNRAGQTFDDMYSREEVGSSPGSTAWCAMFYSCMAQAVQRGGTEVLLYGALCEALYSKYSMTDAYVVFCEDSYLMEHLQGAGKGEDSFYEYVVGCSGNSVDKGTVQEKIEVVRVEDFVPQPGDLVFFHWSTDSVSVGKWITHIGIVYSYDQETGNVTVIEGNRNGNHNAMRSEVARTEYQDDAENWALSKKNFVGYVRPVY